MRTTIDVPDELLRAVKKKAADHDEKLKDVFVRALEREVGITQRPMRRRLTLPLVHSDSPGSVTLSNADIAETLAEDDTRRAIR